MDGYDPEHYQRIYEVEQKHFWFVGRNRALSAVLSTLTLPGSIPSILEVGCGTGNTLRMLRGTFPSAPIVGVDMLLTGLRLAARRTGGTYVQARIEQLPFRSQFDLIGAFDVLEHIEEEARPLDLLRRQLRPGGALVVTVPASRALWSLVDVEARHCRRYDARMLRDTLTAAGFCVEYQTYFMAGLYPLAWMARRLGDLLPNRERDPNWSLARELTIVPGLNASLRSLLTLEAKWLAGRRQLPFGMSLLAIARSTCPDTASL